MARIRTIKPEFFLNEALAELTPTHRLLFAGLWTLADREGRLEDRPRRIKVALLPWDDVDVGALLDDLAIAGLVCRYGTEEQPCIFIPGFKKHQRPHPKETASELPEPGADVFSREFQRLAVERRSDIPSSPAGKGREGVSFPLESGKESWEGDSARPPPLPKKPDDPFASGQSFFAWLQHERHGAGYITERSPNYRALGVWFSEFMGELNGDTERATATIRNFLRSDHWRPKNFPFPAFMKLWRDFVPRKASAA